MVAVHLRAVRKQFGDTTVLHGIDAEIPKGAFAVLVGPSGCGKSTLLRLIAGLEQVTSGEIHFGKRDVTSLPPRERDIAMVFQSYALYPHMTVRDNLAFGLRLRKTDAETIETRVADVAQTLDIAHLLDRFPRQLSGGQRQRVAMGRAIVRRPALFMFDEPLSNLDPALRTQVRVDIRRLHDAHQATSVYVTHDQVEAMTLADVLFVLNKGHVQQAGAPLEIYQRPANRFVAEFLGSPAMNILQGVIRRQGEVVQVQLAADDTSVPIRTPELFAGLDDGRAVLLGIRAHDVTAVEEDSADLRLTPSFVETLGSHVHLHGTVAGSPFVAVREGATAPTTETAIGLRVQALHMFDASTEHSLHVEHAG